jgi:hypothetical protein
MIRWVKLPKPNPHDKIPHSIPSSHHDDVLYHAGMHECLVIPLHLHSIEHYHEITQQLDEPVGEYMDPFSEVPVMTYQFLMVWTRFTPAQYNTSYFLYEEDNQEWFVDRELLITIQMALERLQNAISDVIAIVGEEKHWFVIDCEGKLTEQLWTLRELKELIMADKLLKLWVELTFIRLLKLKKLHLGESLATPMGSEDSLPPTPELRECLYNAWHDKWLPTRRVTRWALASGWEAIKADINGMKPITHATRHPFTGNHAMKYADYNIKLEEALDVQPLPCVDAEPYGLGIFVPAMNLEEPQASTSRGSTHSPRAGPGSVFNLPVWPTPPSDPTQSGSLLTYRATSIDLEASPARWQEIPLQDTMFQEAATPTPNPCNWFTTFSQKVSTLGGDLWNALWTLQIKSDGQERS